MICFLRQREVKKMKEAETKIKSIIIEKYGSMKAFCDDAGIPWTTLDSMLKRGFTNSSIGNVMKVAKELGISVEPLADGIVQDIKTNISYTRGGTPTEEELRLMRKYHAMNEEGKGKVREYIDDLADKYMKKAKGLP